MKAARQRGFTLIELLVVIGIIAILAAFIFPVAQRTMRSARQTATLAMFKSIHDSLETYRMYFNAYPPPVGGNTSSSALVHHLRDRLQEFDGGLGFPMPDGRRIESLLSVPPENLRTDTDDDGDTTTYIIDHFKQPVRYTLESQDNELELVFPYPRPRLRSGSGHLEVDSWNQ